jgi:hypothetical protein
MSVVIIYDETQSIWFSVSSCRVFSFLFSFQRANYGAVCALIQNFCHNLQILLEEFHVKNIYTWVKIYLLNVP